MFWDVLLIFPLTLIPSGGPYYYFVLYTAISSYLPLHWDTLCPCRYLTLHVSKLSIEAANGRSISTGYALKAGTSSIYRLIRARGLKISPFFFLKPEIIINILSICWWFVWWFWGWIFNTRGAPAPQGPIYKPPAPPSLLQPKISRLLTLFLLIQFFVCLILLFFAKNVLFWLLEPFSLLPACSWCIPAYIKSI